MIYNDDIKVYVAAKKASAPKLPLREALVTVAIECVFEPKPRNKSSSNRNRIFIKDILRRRTKVKRAKAYTVYKHDEQHTKLASLTDYIEGQKAKRTNKHDNATVGHSTLSSLTMTKVLQKDKLESQMSDFLEVESFMPIDPPSLDATEVEDGTGYLDNMDDMTMNTAALIGGTESKVPPGVVITSADESSSNEKWWFEDQSRLSPLNFEDPKDDEDGIVKETGLHKNEDEASRKKKEDDSSIKTEEYTISDSLLGKDMDAQSDCMTDMSSIVDSTCAIFCPNGEVLFPDDHDLKLKVELDDDINSIYRRQKVANESKDSDSFIEYFNEKQETIMLKKSLDQQDELFCLLEDPSAKIETVKSLLDSDPQLLKRTRLIDGRLPIHVVCDHGLPSEHLEESEDDDVNANDVLTSCIKAITNQRMLLKLVTWSHIEACGKHDKNGDLPCHIFGRRIFRWMILLQTFMKNNHFDVLQLERMMMISRIITECVDVVLRPISTNAEACNSTGSDGEMLPLHISILYGGSMDVFKTILETNPEGSKSLFKFEGCKHVLSNALLEKIQNDQKQFHELLCNAGNLLKKPLEWYTTIPGSFYEDDFIRRSDLLFCFNPTHAQITDARINRIEKTIKSEARKEKGNFSGILSPASEAAWIWLCARYKNVEELEMCDHCIDNILNNLESAHVQRLLDITTDGGEKLGFARPRVRKRVFEAASKQPLDQREVKPNISNQGRDESSMASMCRSVFGIEEESVPVHFVVFPFQIEPTGGGKGMLVSQRNANLAVEFSNFMLHETTADTISQSITEKIQMQDNLLLTRSEEKGRGDNRALLSNIYRKGGWLYFIDEHTGKPILNINEDRSLPLSQDDYPVPKRYPIPMTKPSTQVKILLPLMRMGMILMRKSRCVSILSNVLVQCANRNGIRNSLPSWKDTASDLLGPLTKLTNSGGEIDFLRNKLTAFVAVQQKMKDEEPLGSVNNASIDWSLELTFLQLLLENRGLSAVNMFSEVGMIKQRISKAAGNVAWTAFTIDDNPSGEVHRNLAKVEEILNNEDTIQNAVTANIDVSKAAVHNATAASDFGDEEYMSQDDAETKHNLSALKDFLKSCSEEDKIALKDE